MRKRDPADNLYNRRLLAYVGIVFAIAWDVAILTLNCFIPAAFSDAKVVAFLGVPSAIAALNFWHYALAARKDDERCFHSSKNS